MIESRPLSPVTVCKSPRGGTNRVTKRGKRDTEDAVAEWRPRRASFAIFLPLSRFPANSATRANYRGPRACSRREKTAAEL